MSNTRFCIALACLSASVWAQPVANKIDPCTDFFRYACSTWVAEHPIPPDQSQWGTFNELAERNRTIMRAILEKAAVAKPGRDPVDQQIGDLYGSCMDEQTINRKGLDPIKPELDRLTAITAKNQLRDELVRLHKMNVNVFFAFGSGADAKNSKMNIAQVYQAGLGLPDRDYYLKDDPKSATLRKQYVQHIQKILELSGEPVDKASADSNAVLSLETDLAKGALDRVSRRDPQKTYHKMTVHELVSLAPFLDWQQYFASMGAPKLESLNVTWPNFFRQVESVVVQHSLDDLKTYMRWQLLHDQAPQLTAGFVNENFAFYGSVLTGAKELRARWKRCVALVDGDLGEALGRKYVDQTLGEAGKQRTIKMVQEIEKALREDLQGLTWMTPATKKEALLKLEAVKNKIGYPEKWRDYSSVKIEPGDLIGNDLRATEFEIQRRVGKIGQPVDTSEWGMTPPTVNAYYSPLQNNINFPAGILQPPFYDNKADDAQNYGAIGAVVGHELTHGFDDQGRQFDPQGNLRDWWTAEDAKEFEKRADCFVKEYESFEPIPGVHLNGKLTLGENSADNGGLRLAFMALMESLKGKPGDKINGLTPQQRLFVGWGRVWCESTREEMSRLMAQTNPHSPGQFRINGVVSNMPEFAEAFSCKVGQPMVREPACRVW